MAKGSAVEIWNSVHEYRFLLDPKRYRSIRFGPDAARRKDFRRRPPLRADGRTFGRR